MAGHGLLCGGSVFTIWGLCIASNVEALCSPFEVSALPLMWRLCVQHLGSLHDLLCGGSVFTIWGLCMASNVVALCSPFGVSAWLLMWRLCVHHLGSLHGL